jgi:hypothetical protein
MIGARSFVDMGGSTDLHKTEERQMGGLVAEGEKRDLILSELERVLESKPFRTSNRSRLFLRYVVLHSINGQSEKLKERTIGIDVYQRVVDYATGDDPVVRVSASEVRKRLEQYYYTAPHDTPVRIEIPMGSYTPEYHWASLPIPVAESLSLAVPGVQETDSPDMEVTTPRRRRKSGLKLWSMLTGLLFAVGAMFTVAWVIEHRTSSSTQSVLYDFWAPALNSQHPILICLARPVVYRPKIDLYEKFSRMHPGTFTTEDQRDNQQLPLNPNEMIAWKDMEVYSGYGVAGGDVEAAVSISDLFTAMKKSHQLRIGNDYSFQDLRTSPSVIVGAFNNRWTLEMNSGLHFAFVWGVGIQEQGSSGRTWNFEGDPTQKNFVDYGLVTRLVTSKTGQFVVSVAGPSFAGTQTAGEFVSSSELLEQGLKSAPSDWRTKNFQLILKTNVIDGIPGPPHVVASYFW